MKETRKVKEGSGNLSPGDATNALSVDATGDRRKPLNLLEKRDEVRNMCSEGMVPASLLCFGIRCLFMFFQDGVADSPICVFDCAR